MTPLTFDTTGHAVPSGDGWADMCRQLTALHQLDGDALARVAHAVQAHPDWPISTLARWADTTPDTILQALPIAVVRERQANGDAACIIDDEAQCIMG